MQEKILTDIKNGKETDWKGRRLQTEKQREVYRRLSRGGKIARFVLRVKQLDGCATLVEKRGGRIYRVNFCKCRLCPHCAKRRSMKIFGQVSEVMNKVQSENEYSYVFLTLTAKNVKGEDLQEELKRYFKSWDRMTKRKVFKNAVEGWFRALEVEYDGDKRITKKKYKKSKKYYDNHGIKVGDENPNYDMYHPHFHVILAVEKRYFKDSDKYITQKEWVELWGECMRLDYLPSVFVCKVKPKKDKEGNEKSLEGAVAEVAKYTVKPETLKFEKAVEVLDYALEGRRLVAFGGALKEAHKKLDLDDAVDGELGQTHNEKIRDDIDDMIERYQWRVGFAGFNYYLVEDEENDC